MTTAAETAAIRLSVCIPTYNFGAFIGEALDSILAQWQPGVELVVLDSASTDDTSDVVRHRQRDHACLRYERAAERRGIDRDMASVVALARGEYVWLFSADDVARPDAIARLLDETKSGDDVYVCMHTNETIDMKVLHERHPVLNLATDASFELADPARQAEYFALVASTEGFFSYMSGLAIRRAKWNAVDLNEAFVGSCWAHVARLFDLMPSGLRVRFIAAVLVRRRGDNDSFATQGLVRRYALSIRGFVALARHFWGDDSPQAFHVRRVLRAEFPLRIFWAAKVRCAESPASEDIVLLGELMALAYADRSLSCAASRLAFRVLPARLYRPTRETYLFLRGRARKTP